ncbi:MAG: hypothetical protein GY719_34665 [bacterium]|nr:hypothetical protein [bacterium]
MPPSTPSPSTVAYLHAHGLQVTPEQLDGLVQEAIDRLQQELFRSDPRRELSREEIEILEAGGFDLEPVDLGGEDPLARAAALYSGLLKTSLDTAAAARLLGVDPSRIRHRLTSRPPSLYGIRLGSGWRLPRFQFDGERLVPGIGEVVAELDPELHPATVHNWFVSSNPDLVAESLAEGLLSPRDWLCHGFPPRAVAALARHL